MATYEEALVTLYRGPLDAFVAERKRLASVLKIAGDKAGAARLSKVGRPSLASWAVNQLWWQERETFEQLLASAARLRRGEFAASATHQQTLGTLRSRAASQLEAGGHAASESTLRRVTTTLSALAAIGSFDPDPPGMLVGDRDPPGFEVFDAALGMQPSAAAPKASSQVELSQDRSGSAHVDAAAEELAQRDSDEQRRVAEQARAAQERSRLEAEERARKRVEQQRLDALLRKAQADALTQRDEVDRLRRELDKLEEKLMRTEATIAELQTALSALT